MEFLRHVVVLVHLVGFAILFGAWVVEAVNRKRRFTRLMDWGLAIAGVAGLILAAPWGIEYDLNYVKIGVKLVILLVIGALLGIGRARQRKTDALPAAMFWAVGVLTFTNAALAVLWR
ncbi:Fe-S protein [Microbacterium ureisolvens]|uniref:Fe-S protein n=1 Tax=Microbacterium ureisolvens TaxID=2781186 RepID=UPI00362ED0B1